MPRSDAELTRLAAEEVMQWHLEDPDPCHMPGWWADSRKNLIFMRELSWSPLTDWRAAGEIAEVISKRYCFQLDSVGHAPRIWRCMIGWSDDPVSVTYEDETGPRAITISALLAVGAITDAGLLAIEAIEGAEGV